MVHRDIAKAAPFCGAPKIMTPSVIGANTGKEILYYIPVLGSRPLTVTAEGLPKGLVLEGQILSGILGEDGEFDIHISAVNSAGTAEKKLHLSVAAEDNLLLTPLMGFTTWNAFGEFVTQKNVEDTAEYMAESGLREYGYRYVNLDSGWQHRYGGEYDAIQPNPKFPDMKAMTTKLHSMGFLCGIYSTPMLTAWGCPPEYASIPGCTRGEKDPLYTDLNGGIGKERCEENNVRQWEAWGFDYLKYDWYPTDPANAEPMKQALRKSGRAFAFCVTVDASWAYADYWNKTCNSWRQNTDSHPKWSNILARFGTLDTWAGKTAIGHFYDQDMLEIGVTTMMGGDLCLTEEEELFSYTMRAFFNSPLQLSCRLDRLTEFERDMVMNEEILAIHQDALCCYPEFAEQKETLRVYKRKLENGDTAYAVFNTGSDAEDYPIAFCGKVRDVWAKQDLAENTASIRVKAHCVRVLRVSE